MSVLSRLLALAKKVPLDLGQESQSDRTMGKVVALRCVPEVSKENHGQPRALDVGCRQGVQTRLLAKQGYRVVSIDVERDCPECMLMNADRPLGFRSGCFDLVWCSEVIEHLSDPESALQEMRRVLKPGGRLIVTTPNSYFWLMRPLHALGLSPARLQRADHRQFFRLRDIRRLFPKARVCGYFPYAGKKFCIERFLGALTPTFVVVEDRV